MNKPLYISITQVLGLAECALLRSSVQFVGEVQQEGYMQVALGFLDFRTRENGEAFAIGVQVKNPNKVRQ